MDHLKIKELIEDIKLAKKRCPYTVLMLDYDGTLFPFIDDITQSFLDEETILLLKQLIRKTDFDLGIVTGRGLADIKQFIPIEGLFFITNHGYLIEHQKERLYFTNSFNNGKHWFYRYDKIANQMKIYPELFIEKKELSTTFHYRNVPENLHHKCKKDLLNVIKTFFGPKEVKIKEGKQMIEILPNEEMNKGLAIEFVLHRIQEKIGFDNDPLSIFIGDDKTDEDAFRFLNNFKQFSVKVGEEKTEARYRLENIEQVRTFLQQLSQIF